MYVKSLLTGFGLKEDETYEVKEITKYDYAIFCGNEILLRDKCFFLPLMEDAPADGTQINAALSATE